MEAIWLKTGLQRQLESWKLLVLWYLMMAERVGFEPDRTL